MIDIMSVCQAYAKREIDNIALIESRYNPADALTKRRPNETLLVIFRRIASCTQLSNLLLHIELARLPYPIASSWTM